MIYVLVVIVVVLLLLCSFMLSSWMESNDESDLWRKIATENKRQRDSLVGMIATHRIDLDDEKLWGSFLRWRERVE